MAQPMSSQRVAYGPWRAGWRVMGRIPNPHRWLNGEKHNAPTTRTLVPLSLPNAQRPALNGTGLNINAPVPRNLFPGLVQMRRRPNGW